MDLHVFRSLQDVLDPSGDILGLQALERGVGLFGHPGLLLVGHVAELCFNHAGADLGDADVLSLGLIDQL